MLGPEPTELCLDAVQTQAKEEELDNMVLEATDFVPGAEVIDYHAFVTKMMAT